ncbi:hypothetical protein NKI61_27360 [Mesorhizobium sp. M0514]|uniref:hypothetical protein n=1 Tax=Mesorhizobium sp. M0514 TaxID=2956955 RepID=UPI00333903FA
MEEPKITESCGCVFCDVGLEPESIDGRLVHSHPTRGNGSSLCTKPVATIIDLNERRNAAERPDPEFIRKDEYGRSLYCFVLSFDMGHKQFGTELWAYDTADAEAKVAAMRESLRCDGQLYCVVPA